MERDDGENQKKRRTEDYTKIKDRERMKKQKILTTIWTSNKVRMWRTRWKDKMMLQNKRAKNRGGYKD